MPNAERWNWYREHTPATRNVTYLNCGWSGPMTTQVADAMRHFLEREMTLGPTTQAVFDERVARRESYRALMAAAVGAEPEEITIAQNTTEGINIVLNGLAFAPGSNVVTTSVEHPSGIVPAYYLRERRGMDLRVVRLSGADTFATTLEKFDAAIDERTAVVLISEVSFATGQLLPLAGIVEIAHRRGARVLVDGAQTAGHIPVDVRASNVDYYAFTAHKWLLGPDGVGALFVRRDLVAGLEPAKVAGRAAAEWDFEGNFAPQREAITKFELTTVSGVVVAGAHVAAEQYLESGPATVFERARELNRAAEARFARIPGVELASPRIDETRTGLFAFRVEGEEARRVSTYLQAYHRVVCRSVASENAVRLSLHVYNTTDDIEAAARGVEQAVAEGIPAEVASGISE